MVQIVDNAEAPGLFFGLTFKKNVPIPSRVIAWCPLSERHRCFVLREACCLGINTKDGWWVFSSLASNLYTGM